MALSAQSISAEEKADTTEMPRRAIGLMSTEAVLVQNALKLIPQGDWSYVVIHGNQHEFKIFEENTWKTVSHRSLARWISERKGYDGKTIVLLSCSNIASAANLANALAALDKKAKKATHKVIAWEGHVQLYATGYIQGKGVCKQFDPATVANPVKILTGVQIPKGIGKAEGRSVILLSSTEPIIQSIEQKMKDKPEECLDFFVNIDDYNTPTLYYTILTEADKLKEETLVLFCSFFNASTHTALSEAIKAGLGDPIAGEKAQVLIRFHAGMARTKVSPVQVASFYNTFTVDYNNYPVLQQGFRSSNVEQWYDFYSCCSNNSIVLNNRGNIFTKIAAWSSAEQSAFITAFVQPVLENNLPKIDKNGRRITSDFQKAMNGEPDLIDIWKNITFLTSNRDRLSFLQWLKRLKSAEHNDFRSHILEGEILRNAGGAIVNLKGVHFQSALKTGTPLRGDIQSTGTKTYRVTPPTGTIPTGVYKVAVRVWSGTIWVDKADNGGISTFFPDEWDKERVLEEIAFAASKMNTSNYDAITDSYEVRMSSSNDYLRIAINSSGKIITAYPKF